MGREERFHGSQPEPQPHPVTRNPASPGEAKREDAVAPPPGAAPTPPPFSARKDGSPPSGGDRAGGTPSARPAIDTDGVGEIVVDDPFHIFRARRHGIDALHPLRVDVEVWFGEAAPLRAEVLDVSQTGIAMSLDGGLAIAPNDVLSRLVVRVEQHVFYDGSAVVRWVRQEGAQTVAGTWLADGILDTGEVLLLHSLKKAAEGGDEPIAWADRKSYVEGHEAIKAAIADLCVFLEGSREKLDKLEKDLPWDVVHGRNWHGPVAVALRGWLLDTFARDFGRQVRRLDELWRTVAAEDAVALRHWARCQLDGLLLRAPILAQAKNKPRGYPGDFIEMMFIYRHHWEGATLFDRALHFAVAQDGAPVAVRNRKDLLKQRLVDALQSGKRRLNVAIVAAGPALELAEALDEVKEIPCDLEVVLYDQDAEALAYAYSQVERARVRHNERVRCHYVHRSVKQLLDDPELLGARGSFDLILCAGLFDYLHEGLAARLVSHFFGQLAAGGEAWVGNMHPRNTSRYLMEAHLDWLLLYRSHDEMLGFAARGAPGADLRIVQEPTGINPFVVIRRA